MTESHAPLERLIEQLEEMARPALAPPSDAIDAVLSAEPRRTEVASLRDHESVVRFRRELSTGLIAAETATSLLQLVGDLVRTVVGRPRA